ncbi:MULTISPECIES: fatty acid desaturase [unclassified Duganella]|uniref:fatty acid desaturase n=1 Tax=unclassified Duganella TaxID=2636909 RepID=UPI000E348E58|nr:MULTISPECIES: fatty acid desaturase [unclassified Duganella]RFP18803.1 fatty acid desaturase [Duganella sp. BJB475]RFP35468.1 fatty acid desaturase [Duganella sp. BJB476]
MDSPSLKQQRSEYVDAFQRAEVVAERGRLLWLGEWPTWLLIVVIYGGWFLTLTYWRQIGDVPATLLMIWWCAWYMSLQHELIHGHPTPWAWVNRLFGYAPLAIWYPYRLYRDSHLRHHIDFHLTMPALDTESYYVSPAVWAGLSKPVQLLYWFNKTFWGRLLVGPAIAVAAAWSEALRQPLRGEWRNVPMWLIHFAMLGGLLWWVHAAFGMSPLYYVLAISYPAQSLTMIRSYYEHRPAAEHKQRIVLNEAGFVFRVLFLNNNLHLVHHDLPSLPWYLLPRVYRARRAAYNTRSGGFHLHGYGELMRRFGFTPVDAPVHPNMPDT